MNLKTGLIQLLVALAVGYGLGRYLQPAEVRTETKEVVKEVEKIKRDIVIVEREIKNPDGTITIDRRTEDKSEEAVTRDKKSESESIVKAAKPDWKVDVIAQASKLEPSPESYGVHVSRRILGSVFIGAYGDTNKKFGLSVGYEF